MTGGSLLSGFVCGVCFIVICRPLPLTAWQFIAASMLAWWIGALLGEITDRVRSKS